VNIENLEKKINDFLGSKKTDLNYLEFLENLHPAISVMENSEHKGSFKEPTFNKLFFPNAILKDVCELDMIRFSYNILKSKNKDPNLDAIINVIEKMPQDDYKVKKLRVNVYLSLQYVYSGFFNIELYKEVSGVMVNSMHKLEEIIRYNKKEVLGIGYDSISFVADEKEGQRVCNEVNKQLETKVRVRYYPKVVKVMDLSNYHLPDGKVILKRLTRTPEQYESVKQEMLKCVEMGDFPGAYKAIVDCDLSTKVKKRYVAVLNEIKKRGV